MKSIISTLFAASSLVLSVNASAGVWAEGVIVSVQNNHANHVLLKWDRSAPYNCGGGNQIIMRKTFFDGNQDMFERAYSGVLMGLATQKPTRFQLDGCEGKSMKAVSVQICGTDPCVQ